MNKRSIYKLGIIWLILLTLPIWLPAIGGYTALGSRIIIYGLAAMGLNLLLGYTGYPSFGHAAYFGAGAYATGLAIKFLDFGTPAALLFGVLCGGVIAIICGFICVRLKGLYFSMLTIAIGQLFYFIALRWTSVTGGTDGLIGFTAPDLLILGTQIKPQGTALYYLCLLCFAIAVGLMGLIIRSPLGRGFAAVKENELKTKFLGIHVRRLAWAGFAISGFVVALAGSLNLVLNNFTAPTDLYWILSGEFLIMAVLGGMSSFWGPLIGAAAFIVIQDYVSSLTVNWLSIIGLFFMIVVLVFPSGVVGMIGTLKNKYGYSRTH